MRSLQDDEANIDSLIAHVELDQETGSYISSNKNSVVEIEATIVPFSPRPDLGLVQHNGDYNKKGWSAKTYHRLSISELAMQARNPPHYLTFPAGKAGATQYQEDSAGCCRWLSLCYIK